MQNAMEDSLYEIMIGLEADYAYTDHIFGISNNISNTLIHKF